jgi:UTP--glucose-1-phosphate uridylyltransferase
VTSAPACGSGVGHNVPMETSEARAAAAAKMSDAGAHPEAIRSFESAYDRLVGGSQGLIATDTLEPAGDVSRLEDLPALDEQLATALGQVALIKLNGGLATSMGLREPKSLMEVAPSSTSSSARCCRCAPATGSRCR